MFCLVCKPCSPAAAAAALSPALRPPVQLLLQESAAPYPLNTRGTSTPSPGRPPLQYGGRLLSSRLQRGAARRRYLQEVVGEQTDETQAKPALTTQHSIAPHGNRATEQAGQGCCPTWLAARLVTQGHGRLLGCFVQQWHDMCAHEEGKLKFRVS